MSNSFDDILDEPEDDNVSGDENEVETPETEASTVTSEPETEAPEAVVETPAVEAEAEPVAREDGFKQDSRGVWHRPDGTIASKDEVAKITAETPAVETPVVPEAEAPKVETPAVQATPFRYRSMGANHELPGTAFDASTGRMTVEPEGLGQIRQALNALHLLPAFQTENANLKKQVEQRGPGEAKATKLVDALSAIIENPNEEEAIAEFFQLRQAFPSLKSQAEVDYWKQQAQGIANAQPQKAEAVSSALPSPDVALSTTNEHLEHFKLDQEFRTMTDADWQQIGDSLKRKPYAFIRPATQVDAEQYGVSVGELVFDTDAMAEDIKTYQQTTSKAREAEANAKKVKEAAKFNAQQTTTTPAKPLTKRVPATAAVAGKKTEKSWDDKLKEAWSDDDEE